MNSTLRGLLLILCPVIFAVTSFAALWRHAMPWPALLGCFALMGGLIFATWLLSSAPRPARIYFAIWFVPVGLIASLQSMWHELAGHPAPAFPIFAVASVVTFLGLGLLFAKFLATRRAG